LQNWEQHRRNPTGAAALLPIFDREQETAMKALHSAVSYIILQILKRKTPLKGISDET
jgi:hypothetical protein